MQPALQKGDFYFNKGLGKHKQLNNLKVQTFTAIYKRFNILFMASLTKPYLHQDILIHCLCVITTTEVSTNARN